MPEPDYYRLFDANQNRVCEGLRVLEDWFRFARPDPGLVSLCKLLRHRVREQPALLWPQLLPMQLRCRNSLDDCGPEVTGALDALGKTQHAYFREINLVTANCKRIQEGLRSLEEICRLTGQASISELFENCRYQSYELEKMCFQSLQAAGVIESTEDRVQPAVSTYDLTDYFCGLYGITMADTKRGRDHTEVGLALLDAGIRVLQYRNKTDDMKKQYEDCLLLAKASKSAGALFIVNDRLDLALAVQADGIHLGQEDLPLGIAGDIIRTVRKKEKDGSGDKKTLRMKYRYDNRPFLIGLSTHNPGQARAAVLEGVDYIGVGPVFATRTKTDMKSPVAGLDYLAWTAAEIHLPQVAIGGISQDNLGDVLGHGARCCALISSVSGQEDITAAARQVHTQIREGTGEGKERILVSAEKS